MEGGHVTKKERINMHIEINSESKMIAHVRVMTERSVLCMKCNCCPCKGILCKKVKYCALKAQGFQFK